MTVSAHTLRRIDLFEQALGNTLVEYLSDPDVVEIMVNPGGGVWVESLVDHKQYTGVRITPEQIVNVIKIVASFNGISVNEEQPEVAGLLPGNHARFQGWLPPVSEEPVFAIRKHGNRCVELDDYIDKELMSSKQAEVLRQAVLNRQNILIGGGTSTGKTTLAGALLRVLKSREDRVFILEDVPELHTDISDQVVLRTTEQVTMRDLVRSCLRMRPDRIIIGEVRDGAALDLLKAWNTGHPGGISTIHANSAEAVVSRLNDLIGEVIPAVPMSLITNAVELIVQLDNNKHTRGRIASIVHLSAHGEKGYVLEEVE